MVTASCQGRVNGFQLCGFLLRLAPPAHSSPARIDSLSLYVALCLGYIDTGVLYSKATSLGSRVSAGRGTQAGGSFPRSAHGSAAFNSVSKNMLRRFHRVGLCFTFLQWTLNNTYFFMKFILD